MGGGGCDAEGGGAATEEEEEEVTIASEEDWRLEGEPNRRASSDLIWLGLAGTTGLFSTEGEVSLLSSFSGDDSSLLPDPSLNSPLFLTACFLLSSSSQSGFLLCVSSCDRLEWSKSLLLLSSLVGIGGFGGGCFLMPNSVSA